MNTNKAENWNSWLKKERHISREVMNRAKVVPMDDELVIPVLGTDGKVLFNKYRRPPWAGNGPKYRYEQGASAGLFGLETITNIDLGSRIIITEGELDALAMRTLDYIAVSSTGGSKTWKEEWNKYFDGMNTVILYDADPAGVEGTMRLHEQLPDAAIAWCPIQFGKDPTEVIHKGGIHEIQNAVQNARFYPQELDQLLWKLKKEKDEANRDPWQTPYHRDLAIIYVQNKINEIKNSQKRKVKRDGDRSAVENARTYPIENLVKASRDGFMKCLFHTENSASMKIYKDGHFYCYGCSKRGDVIDVYRALNPGVSFPDAVTALNLL